MTDAMDWKEYEKEIEGQFRTDYPKATITRNAKVLGRFSKIERDVDLLVEDHASDFCFRIAIDAKHYKERVDVKDVEQFLGLLNDIGADLGVMVCPEGYSQAAVNRAHFDDSRLELEILNFKELKFFQAFGAIAIGGGWAVAMPAPFGWVIDARRDSPWIACLHVRGDSLDEAVQRGEWMYVNFWIKNERVRTIQQLLEFQQMYLSEGQPEGQFSSVSAISRDDQAPTHIRVFEAPGYSTPEFTGFVEFKEFIFFAVLFSPENLREKNLRKLRYVMRRVLPIKVKNYSLPPAQSGRVDHP